MSEAKRESDAEGMRFVGDPELIESLPSGSKIFAQKVEFDLPDRAERVVTDRDAAYKQVLERTRLLLKPLGFRKRGAKFVRNLGISTQEISFSKSQWNTREDPVHFSVGLGFFLHCLKPSVDPDRPRFDDYGLRLGLGFLYQPTQTSWDLYGSEDVDEVWAELGAALRDHGIPALDAGATETGMMELARTRQAAIYVELRDWLAKRNSGS